MTATAGSAAQTRPTTGFWPVLLCWLAVALDGYDLVVLGAVIPTLDSTGALGFDTGSLTTAANSAHRFGRAAVRCPRTDGNFAHASTQTSALNPASAMNGAPLPYHSASIRPAGRPAIEATANAEITAPLARPRFSGGNTSPITAIRATAAVPPNAPASVRDTRSHS